MAHSFLSNLDDITPILAESSEKVMECCELVLDSQYVCLVALRHWGSEAQITAELLLSYLKLEKSVTDVLCNFFENVQLCYQGQQKTPQK